MSSLHQVLTHSHLLHQTGYDKKNHTAIYDADSDQMSSIESNADCSITTIALGISAIGKLIAGQDKMMGCFTDEDACAIGWLLTDLGASIVALQNIQTTASDAVNAAKK